MPWSHIQEKSKLAKYLLLKYRWFGVCGGGFLNLNPIMIESNQSSEYNWDTSQIWKLYSWRLISSHPFLQSDNWLGSFWSGEVSWGQCQRSDIFGHFQIKRSSRTKREKCKLWNLLWAVSAVCENQEIYLGKSAIFYVKIYSMWKYMGCLYCRWKLRLISWQQCFQELFHWEPVGLLAFCNSHLYFYIILYLCTSWQ